jgi:hypothetical protein
MANFRTLPTMLARGNTFQKQSPAVMIELTEINPLINLTVTGQAPPFPCLHLSTAPFPPLHLISPPLLIKP